MKMSNIIILSLISLGIITSFSFIFSVKKEFKMVEFSKIEGSDKLVSKTLELGEFHGIEAHDQVKVFIKQGPSSVEISAEDNLLEFLKVENKDGILKIYLEQEDRQNITRNLPMIIKISNPLYEKIKANEQSEIQVEDVLKQSQIIVELENQSNFRGELDIDSIIINLAQQSNAYLNGNCQLLNLKTRDQSGIRANKLDAEVVNVQISDQSDAQVNALKSISGSVRGNASLSLKKLPEDNSISKSKMANVNNGI